MTFHYITQRGAESEDVGPPIRKIVVGSGHEGFNFFFRKTVLVDAPIRSEKKPLEVAKFDVQIVIQQKIVDVDIAVDNTCFMYTATASLA